MTKLKLILTALICSLVLNSCSRTSSNFENESKLVEFAELKGFDLTSAEKVLVVPAEVTCESCVMQIVSFINSLVLPENTRFVFTSYSKMSLDNFIEENKIEISDQFFLDEENFFFVNNLIMIHPVLFEMSGQDIERKELYPVNVFESLKEIFDQDGCNEVMIDEIFDLEVKGALVSRVDGKRDTSTLLFRDVEDEEKEFEIELNKRSADILLKYFSVDDIVIKYPRTFDIQVIEIMSDFEALKTRKTIKCK